MEEILRDHLITARVIGDVLEHFTPTVQMIVSYDDKQVDIGDELFPSTVTNKPVVKLNLDAGDFDSFFTLVMIDPDVPNSGEHLHWLVTDIHDTLIPSINGRELLTYESPNPNIRLRRFVFALFKQKRMHSVTALPSSRDNFNTKNFAAENDLGLPVAAVYFYAQRETAP